MSIAAIASIDVGSSGVRAELFDLAGHSCGPAVTRPHVVLTTPDGGALLDALTVVATCEAALDQLLATVPAGVEIVAVASDTLVPNIIGLDANDEPITPVLTWGDTRAADDAHALWTVLDRDDYHQRTGCRLHASYVPAKIRWLTRTQPAVAARVRRWLSLGEYCWLRWFGTAGCSWSVAAWSGLLNRQTLDWDAATLAAVGITAAQLGELRPLAAVARGLRPAYAARWPQLAQLPWLPTVGDGVSSTLGSDCTTPDRVALVIGTSGALRVLLPRTPATVPPGLWLYQLDRERALLGGALSNGGNVFAWLTHVLRLPPPAELEAALTALAPAAHGLTMLPFLAGERSPGWADSATGTLAGLRWNTQPVEIVQAALEAVALRVALVHQQLAPELPAEHTLIASGGGLLGSAAWLQIMADVLGQPVVSSGQPAATSRGSALLAAETLGLAPLPVRSLDDQPRWTPRPAHHLVYQRALAEQVALYETLIRRR